MGFDKGRKEEERKMSLPSQLSRATMGTEVEERRKKIAKKSTEKKNYRGGAAGGADGALIRAIRGEDVGKLKS